MEINRTKVMLCSKGILKGRIFFKKGARLHGLRRVEFAVSVAGVPSIF